MATNTPDWLRLIGRLDRLKEHFILRLAHVVVYYTERDGMIIVSERSHSSLPCTLSQDQLINHAGLLAKACQRLSEMGLAPSAEPDQLVAMTQPGWIMQLCPFPAEQPGESAALTWGNLCREVCAAQSTRIPGVRDNELGWLLSQPNLRIDELTSSLRELQTTPREVVIEPESTDYSPRTYLVLAGIMLSLLSVWILLATSPF